MKHLQTSYSRGGGCWIGIYFQLTKRINDRLIPGLDISCGRQNTDPYYDLLFTTTIKGYHKWVSAQTSVCHRLTSLQSPKLKNFNYGWWRIQDEMVKRGLPGVIPEGTLAFAKSNGLDIYQHSNRSMGLNIVKVYRSSPPHSRVDIEVGPPRCEHWIDADADYAKLDENRQRELVNNNLL